MKQLIIKKDLSTGKFSEEYRTLSAAEEKKHLADSKKNKKQDAEFIKIRKIKKHLRKEGIDTVEGLLAVLVSEGLEGLNKRYNSID